MRTLLLIMLLLGAAAANAQGQATIFVSRHADRGPEEPDAPLTAQGLCQADALGRLLADAGIRHIYTTELTRTRQTAAPTARASAVEPVVVAQEDLEGLIARVRKTARAGEATLVVGHRGTVPRIVRALSGQDIAPLGSAEYTRLIMITLLPDGTASVVTLRQGAGCGGS